MIQVFKESRCYTPVNVAEILNVDISTVYRLIRDIDDPLPAFRLKTNGQLRVHGKEINKYLEDHKVDPLNE
jgi:predicted site-specific integrase-resolvase